MQHAFRQDDRVGQLEADILSRVASGDRQRVIAAVDMAGEAHHGVTRKSGEPFILHPLHVALILAEEGLSADTVIAGVLHDVIEDTDFPAQQIGEQFGDDVLFLVNGVTKVTTVAPRGTPQRDKHDTFRKLVVGAADDARVIVIKLADRLHNMRTISAMKPERQQEIASETLHIYAPIAHRLGMGKMKTELEDLSFRVLDPEAWRRARDLQRTRSGQVGSYVDGLVAQLTEALGAAGVHADVSSRVKSRYSIAEKLKRVDDPDQILDVIGMRVLVEDVSDCYRALGVVHQLWPPLFDRFKDFIATPKSNLYQSLHTTVINPNGRPSEVQIRTRAMHETAEHGIAAHWHYKETLRSGGPAATRRFLEDLADEQQSSERLDEAFIALKQDVLGEEIYAFTPQGDIRLLPAGACAVDFAYAVHTELGHRCVGAKVNGTLVSITRPLRSGDVVQVITGRSANPSPDWLSVVTTARARHRIRQHLTAAAEREQAPEGLRAIADQLRAAGMAPLASPVKLRAALLDLGYNRSEQAALEAANDPQRARQIAERIIQAVARTGPPAASTVAPVKPRRPLAADVDAGVIVGGLEGVDVRMAQCCAPEPGDPVCGYVSMTRGVVIHRDDCPNVLEHRRRNSPRLLDVTWRDQRRNTYRSDVELVLCDRPELLSDIALAVYGEGASLTAINLRTAGSVVRGTLTCLVTSPEHSQKVRETLRGIDGALQVRRRTGDDS